jgi:multidrug efflux pump subunit AcrA (membrane-fusion protein)
LCSHSRGSAAAGDEAPHGRRSHRVEAYDRAQKEKLGSGHLLTADNQIDPATGTIKLKAEFPNTDGTLFANQFVNVRMPVETRANATLVPTASDPARRLGNVRLVGQG